MSGRSQGVCRPRATRIDPERHAGSGTERDPQSRDWRRAVAQASAAAALLCSRRGCNPAPDFRSRPGATVSTRVPQWRQRRSGSTSPDTGESRQSKARRSPRSARLHLGGCASRSWIRRVLAEFVRSGRQLAASEPPSQRVHERRTGWRAASAGRHRAADTTRPRSGRATPSAVRRARPDRRLLGRTSAPRTGYSGFSFARTGYTPGWLSGGAQTSNLPA